MASPPEGIEPRPERVYELAVDPRRGARELPVERGVRLGVELDPSASLGVALEEPDAEGRRRMGRVERRELELCDAPQALALAERRVVHQVHELVDHRAIGRV